jgi:hypothetical protein
VHALLRTASLGCIGLTVFTCARDSCAQTGASFDLTYAHHEVFRGEVLSTRPVVESQVGFSHRISDTQLSAGVWNLAELWAPRSTDFSLRGDNRSPFAQWEFWAQVTRKLFGHDISTGILRSEYANSGKSPQVPYSHSEVFASMERSSDAPIGDSFWYRGRYFRGFAGENLQYGEVSIARYLLVLPMRDVSAGLSTTTGANFSTVHTRPRVRGDYERRGITHFDIAAVLVSMPHCHERHGDVTLLYVLSQLIPKQLIVRKEFAIDPATQLVGPNVRRTSFSTFELTSSPFTCSKQR